MKKKISIVIAFLRGYLGVLRLENKTKVYLVTRNVKKSFLGDILNRAEFYIPGVVIDIVQLENYQKIPIKIVLSRCPVLIVGDVDVRKLWFPKFVGNIYNVDFNEYPHDGWDWHTLADYLFSNEQQIVRSNKLFMRSLSENLSENKNKCYIFGTGQSLAKTINYDWSDGYRVVCNTIVRDRELYEHINPHYIVAGDAIYHFGHTEFSRAFRKDLLTRLTESDAKFIYPASFHALVLREMKSVRNQLIPVPNSEMRCFNYGLDNCFVLPCLGNVLPLLLLPAACTMSKNIYMIGFDGRAPDDKLFWSNSRKHSYPELMDSLIQSHPKFFEHYLKDNSPASYTKKYHGDELDDLMTLAEKDGWRFVLMSKSWTHTLQKRFEHGLINEIDS